MPTNNSAPGPITVAPDGKVWFIEANPSKLAAFNPLIHNFTEYLFQNSSSFSFTPAYISAQDLTTDPRGDLWFTLLGANAIGSFNISSRSFSYYNLTAITGRTENLPFSITSDQTGTIWFTEAGASRIAKLNPVNNLLREYELPQPNATPYGIFIDSNHTLWVTSYWYTSSTTNQTSGSTLFEFNPATGQNRSYELSAGSVLTPTTVVVDSSGRAWIGDHANSWLAEVNTVTGEIKLHRTSVAPGNYYATLANSPVLGLDGTPWFIEHLGGRIGPYIPSNDTLIEYNIPTPNPITYWLVTDRKGGLWFTEQQTNKLGYFDMRSAEPPFLVSPTSLSANITCGQPQIFEINVTDVSPNPLSLTANVGRSNYFSGTSTNVTLSPGELKTVPVAFDSKCTFPGDYSTRRLAPLEPVISITNGGVNYPISINLILAAAPSLSQLVLLYVVIGGIVIAGTGAIVIAYRRRRNHQSHGQIVKERIHRVSDYYCKNAGSRIVS